MGWLADGRTKVLPVLSRTNVRELKGAITLPDVLSAYAMANASPGEPAEAGEPMPSATRMLVGVLAALVGVAVLGGFLTYFYRAERSQRAEKAYAAGNELLQKERLPEAIDQYRYALSISHNFNHRLALALALVKAGRMSEGAIYLNEILRERPNNGPANLGLAEVLAAQGNADQATVHYRRAIVGSWPDKAVDNRIHARLELIDFLAKSHKREQARAELLALAADLPDDSVVRKQVGRMLIDFGLAREATDLFTKLLKRGPPDAGEYDGLGEAQFSAANYKAAAEAYRKALEIDAADGLAARRLAVCEQVLALDPNERGIGSRERFRRSQELLKQALAHFDACHLAGKTLPSGVAEMLTNARTELSRKRAPRSFSDAAEANTTLAEMIWSHGAQSCQTSPDDPTRLILSKQLAAQ